LLLWAGETVAPFPMTTQKNSNSELMLPAKLFLIKAKEGEMQMMPE
jgi:hypothetical protein